MIYIRDIVLYIACFVAVNFIQTIKRHCRKELFSCENFLQLAEKNYLFAKTSCNLQGKIISLRKFPAACREKLSLCENFLQPAGKNYLFAKISCNLQGKIISLRKPPAACREKLFLCRNVLQTAGKNLFSIFYTSNLPIIQKTLA